MKSKEQKRAEAKSRRLRDFENYRQQYHIAVEELLNTRNKVSKNEYQGMFLMSRKATGEELVRMAEEKVNDLRRSMNKAAADAGVDLHGNRLVNFVTPKLYSNTK